MILGLDVSTTRIGWAVIDKDQNLIDSGFYKTDKNKTLEARAEDFRANVLEPLSIVHRVDEVRVEEPFSMFSGGKTTAKTMSSLQRFNGMISLLVLQVFTNPPTMVGSRTARARCGIKVPRGTKAKKVIVEWADNYFDSFNVELTRHGNPKPGTDDEADAIVVALSYFDLR